jgi:hypothetical protein
MPRIVADPLCRPVSTCFPDQESNNFNYLVLILILPRARRVRARRQEDLRQPERGRRSRWRLDK